MEAVVLDDPPSTGGDEVAPCAVGVHVGAADGDVRHPMQAADRVAGPEIRWQGIAELQRDVLAVQLLDAAEPVGTASSHHRGGD